MNETWLDRAQQELPQLLDDVQRLVCLESPSEDRDALDRSASLVAQIGERILGVPPEFLDGAGCPHLRWRFGTGPRRVLVLGHHDTVWPLGTLQAIPWTVQDGVIRGPGCFDMKTGVVQAMYALAMVRDRHGIEGMDGVTLLVTGDEEIGSTTSRQLIEDEAAGCAAALVLEAAAPQGALKIERKGVSMYRIRLTGRASHAGLEPERGVNAGVEMAHQVPAVAALSDPATGTTVTPTRLSAGSSVNTVPATAEIAVDVRARTAEEQQRVDTALRRLQPVLPGSTIGVEGGPNRPPMARDLGADLYDRAARLAPTAGITDLTGVPVGGASDGNFTSGVGVPTLDGLGAVGGGAHAADEHVLVEHIPHRTALVALLVEDLLGAGHGHG